MDKRPAPTIDEYLKRPPAIDRQMGGKRARGNPGPSSTKDHPLISVITVVRNNEKTLRRAIDSVLTQTYGNIEYIIVDGASTDGTLKIIQEYDAQLALWISEPDAGIFDAMNKGISLATGDYIALLNSDDHYIKDALERVAAETRQSHSDVVYGDYIFFIDDLQIAIPTASTLKLVRGMTLCHPAMFISREAYGRLGLYDLSYPVASDFDISLRFYFTGCKFSKIVGPVAYFTGGGNAESNLLRASFEGISIISRHAGSHRTIPFILLYLRRLVLRGINRIIRCLFGARAYAWVRRQFYQRKSRKAQAQEIRR
jgi:glycosyltransferase involved in cell wall biosynthesis